MNNLTSKKKIKRNSGLVYNEIDGQVVMLNLKKEAYYSLNEVGSVIWTELSDPCTLEDLIKRLIEKYEISASRCSEDIEPFLNELVELGVIEILDE